MCSGSTGKAKGVLHTQAGYMLYAATTFKYVFDHQSDDVFWCTADIGWITGHTYVCYGPLANAATSVMVCVSLWTAPLLIYLHLLLMMMSRCSWPLPPSLHFPQFLLYLLVSFTFLLFPFLLASFIFLLFHPFPFYQNSRAPFPGQMS